MSKNELAKRIFVNESNSFKNLLQEIKSNSTIDKNDPLMQLLFDNPNIKSKKLAKELQSIESKPWDYSANLNYNDPNWKNNVARMIMDKYNIQHKPLGEKLNTSFQKSLTYKQERIYEDAKDVSFRDLYAERFTPIGSFEKMDSLADQRIQEYLDSKKGSPQKSPQKLSLNENPYLDRTEFHLNNMLKTQNCNPEWINKQQGIDKTIDSFKERLKTSYISKLIAHLEETGYKIEKANEVFDETIFEKAMTEVANEMDLINSQIRDYNLSLLQISPNLSHLNKWKITKESLAKEISKSVNLRSLAEEKERSCLKYAQKGNQVNEQNPQEVSPKRPWYRIF